MKDHAPDTSALLIGDYENDRLLVHETFEKSGWRLYEALDRREAMDCLERDGVHVVLAETGAPRWCWKEILSSLWLLPRAPQLIVTSRIADDHLWAEALNFGAFDVLARPLDRNELERAVASARRHFDSQPRRAQSVGSSARVA